MSSSDSDPEASAREATILYERSRIIAERSEDQRRAELGQERIEREPIPALRAEVAAFAQAQLDAEDAEIYATFGARDDDAESERVAQAIAALEAEIAALRRPTEEAFIAAARTTRNPAGGISGAVDPSPSPTAAIDVSPIGSGTYGDLLGDFLPTERTQVELECGSMQVISKPDRLRLSASDKSKIYTTFIKGIASKFKASSTIVGLDEISTIDNILLTPNP